MKSRLAGNTLEYSVGNLKVGRDTLIFNMSSATDCPSKKLGMCKHCTTCYALKAEIQYTKHCLPYRRRQEAWWLGFNAEDKSYHITDELLRRKKVKYVRFSEAGDFHEQEYVEHMCLIASQNPDHIFYGYTARVDLDFSKRPPNLIIQGTNFMIDNEFRSYPRGMPVEEGWEREAKRQKHMGVRYDIADCPGSCAGCNLCKESGTRVILSEEH